MNVTMMRARNPSHGRPFVILQVQRVFRLLYPTAGRRDDKAGYEEALHRLAETSPHLLEDIGFVKYPGKSNDVRTIWKSKDFEIEITNAD